ncbi:HNH endonuclease signature motif containing protein [Corynebacterium sp.]|uniref:HNH endonuclease signature motif containing protein n=1 Tax=Corynebacterium sp. TaxID=1720 RepID=UPI0026DB2879|nr:HNH endonuclease signature motif containing protein [Corynebacterium sp.]MDO5031573.1 HNH endonuclease signature motif containing protein [Corynebacterium sp.]
MHDKHERINELLATASKALSGLHTLMQDPSDVYFGRVRQGFEDFEAMQSFKGIIDASFAFIAERDDAGRHVSSSRADDYLEQRLGIPYQEAQARLDAGRKLFGSLEESLGSSQSEQPDPAAGGESQDEQLGDENAARAERERKARERQEREEREREAERKRREEMLKKPLPPHIIKLIEDQLRNLNEGATPGPAELREQATLKAHVLSGMELRQWLRDAIRQANKSTRGQLGNAIPKRFLKASRPDQDGGIWVSAYLEPHAAAMFNAIFAPGKLTTLNPAVGQEDKRTYRQKMADHLTVVMDSFLQNQQERAQGASRGLRSILVAATMDELEGVDEYTRFATNVGVELSALDILRLGLADNDLFCIVDRNGHPLDMGYAVRRATVWQKLALAVKELVCSHEGCDKPWTECEVHHVQAWTRGGPTNLANLTLQCRGHHVDNNDAQDGFRNMGHAERDPDTGRVGFRAPGQPLRFNDSPAAQKAPGRRAAEKSRAKDERKDKHRDRGGKHGNKESPLGDKPRDEPGDKQRGPAPADRRGTTNTRKGGATCQPPPDVA